MIRLEILHGVAQTPKTISELHESIKYPDGAKFDYKAIHKQIILLKDYGLIYLKQAKKKQGRPIMVFLSKNPPINLNDPDISFWWNVLIKKEKLKK